MHQLGAGVLGPVFRASAPETGQPVAIKAFHLDLTPELADELADALQQLVDVGLEHPGIVAPLAVGCEGSVPYLAQDYVAAESLDVAMRHYAPAAAERAVPLIHHLAGAVDAAHEADVLHGCLHLRDVFVSPDEARATGFGVAHALEHVGLRAPVRRPYAAPEVVAGGDWGPEADRYAVAAIAYELLTGRRATGSGDEIIERLGSVYVGDEGALPALRDVFSWGLSEDPAGRPGRAVDLAAGLAEALGVDLVEPEPARSKGAAGSDSDADETEAWGTPGTTATAAEATERRDEPLADDEPAMVGSEEGGAERSEPAVDEGQPGPEADGGSEALPASLREGGRAPTPAPASVEHETTARGGERQTAPAADLAPLDDLEPIVDEEPLTFGGRVRAGLQVAAAVVVGVGVAGAVYFLIGSGAVSGGGGEAVVSGDSGPFDAAPPTGAVSDVEPVELRAGADPSPAVEPAPPDPDAEALDEPAGDLGAIVTAAGIEPPDVERPTAPPGQADAATLREPAAARPEVGWLLVRTFPPGAAVSVSGVDRGRTPLSLDDVPYGVHQVEIQAPGYESETREVTVSAAATVAAVSVDLAPTGEPRAAAGSPSAVSEPGVPAAPVDDDAGQEVAQGAVGSVFVESRPAGARVVVDGEPTGGITPLLLDDLRSGRHEMRIEQDGYRPWTTMVEVPAGGRIRVAASLDRARP